MSKESIYTLAVHAGEDRSQNHGALSVPVYSASVFAFPDAGEGAAIHNYQKEGFFYGRLGNPTTRAFEKTIHKLENGEDALAFASGMAAVSAALLTLAKPGDHIVAPESMYSTTTNLLEHLAAEFNIETTFIDAANADNYAEAVRPNTRVFWLETPSNPLVRITDLGAVAALAKEKGIASIADSTFAIPYNQRQLDLGIDLVWSFIVQQNISAGTATLPPV